VGGVALLVYGATVQRSLSFWDCGEFIACAATLGIPHPPGSPLFVLWGRLFAHLPWPGDIGLRVNLVSVCFGALSVAMGYLIVARLVRRHVLGEGSFWGKDWLVFVCACSGALTAGFGSTVWTNATEAEVYGLTLFLFLLILYISIVWFEERHTARGPRLLVFATFVAGLGLGLHMMVYLALPGLWLTVFAADPQARRDWRLWVAAFATLSVMVTGVEAYLCCLALVLCLGWWCYALPPRVVTRRFVVALPVGAFVLFAGLRLLLPPQSPGAALLGPASWFQWPWTDWLAVAIVAVACLGGLLFTRYPSPAEAQSGWRLPAALVGAALASFSLLIFIPVRSAQNPAIDENNPETWAGLRGFLERKQYGRESMIERMFTRRGEWSHQLGRHPRMGFWSFFEGQYGLQSGGQDTDAPGHRRFAFPILVVLGLWGVLALAWREPRLGGPLFVVLLLCTVGLVVYMNFADGTRYQPQRADQAYLEVRDRDYFFTTGFALFGLCLGLGVAGFLRAFLDPRSRLHKPLVWTASVIFLFSLPWKTLEAHYWTHDRSRNFVAFDYAHNMLNSCQPDALLFTNGDNDTFPLWCLQEAFGLRRDVKIINLSLANTLWYIHQAKARGVPFDLDHGAIERLRSDPQQGRIQDQVLNAVLEANRWRRPVYFGASTPEGSRVFRRLSLDSNLVMEGLVLRLVRERDFRMVDPDLVWRRHLGLYRLRGLADSTLYLDEATRRIADNYASSLLFLADHYRRQKQADSAFEAAALACRLRPRLEGARRYRVQLAGEYNRPEVLDSLQAGLPPAEAAELYHQYGLAAELAGDTDRAEAAYEQALTRLPSHVSAFRRCAGLEFERRQWDSLLALVDRWVAANPDDTVGPKLRAEVILYRDQSTPPVEAP
jgi:tetratricopeptide (TPR) repeat protein